MNLIMWTGVVLGGTVGLTVVATLLLAYVLEKGRYRDRT